MNYRILFLTLFMAQVSSMVSAQNLGINEDGTAAHPSAILDVKSENKGVLIPRISLNNVTSPSPIISPENGLLIYNTNAAVIGGFGEGYYSWNGSQWLKITTGQSLNNLNFTNGINRDGDDVKLGGTLIENTSINKNGNNLTFVGSGNMGIGTTTPTSLLHIVETANIGSVSGLLIQESNAGQALTIEESGNGSGLLITASDNGSGIISTTQGATTTNAVGTILSEIRTSSTGNITKVGLDINSTGTWNGANAQNIGLRVNATGGTTNYAAILSGGNVGVNVLAPIARIQAAAAAGQDAIAGISVNNTGVVGIDFGSGTGVFGAAEAAGGWGVEGVATSTTGTSFGVVGGSASSEGIGVVGNSIATTGATRGVLGISASSGGVGILGNATATTGATVGVQGQTASTAGVGSVGLATATTGNTTGVVGESNSTNGTGVLGNATATTGNTVGVQGQTASTAGVGSVGFATATTGNTTGVVGQANSTNGTGVLGNATATTGATRGVVGETTSTSVNSHGVLGLKLGNANGTGYLWTTTQAGVVGYSDWGQNFRAGVQGATWSNDPGNRTSGVIGIFQNAATTWGALAYKTSGNAGTAVYGTAAYSSGAGYMSNNYISGIGIGGYGGIIGSWSRGDVMGHVSSGELFASYNLGDVYTSGYNAEIIALENERVAVYTMTGTDVKIYNDGTSSLTQGRKRVEFDSDFTQIIGDNIPVITVSPMGACNGLYVTNVSSKGFDVVELANGISDVEFSYIVISKRKDANNKPSLPKDLTKKDFDQNMKDVMFNESNLEQSAKPVWWDGSGIRFDPIPEPETRSNKPQKLESEAFKLNALESVIEPAEAATIETKINYTNEEVGNSEQEKAKPNNDILEKYKKPELNKNAE
jgi:hypothetical protein